MKTKLNILMVVLCFAATAQAQIRNSSTINTDGNGLTSMEEFGTIYSKGYNQMDIDQDGRLNDREFYDSSYKTLDINRDGRLDPEEWKNGDRSYYKSNKYEAYDLDKDSNITSDEFYGETSKSDYFKSYDANGDGFLDNDEMTKGTFNGYDKNRDGNLDSNEIKKYRPLNNRN